MSINVISINKILFWAIFSIKNSNHIYFFCFRFCQFSQHGWLMWRYRSVRTVVWVYVKQKCQLSCGCSISQLLFKWGINVFVLPCENEDVGGKIYRDPEPPVGENKVLNLDSKDWTLKVSWSLFSVIFTALIWSWVLPEQNNLCFLLVVLQKYWAPELINKMDWIRPRRNGRPRPCRQQVDFSNC